MKAMFIKNCSECSNCTYRYNDEFSYDETCEDLPEYFCMLDMKDIPDEIIDNLEIRKDCQLPDVNV